MPQTSQCLPQTSQCLPQPAQTCSAAAEGGGGSADADDDEPAGGGAAEGGAADDELVSGGGGADVAADKKAGADADEEGEEDVGADVAGEGEGEEVDNDDGDAEVGEAPAAALDGFPPFFFVMVGFLEGHRHDPDAEAVSRVPCRERRQRTPVRYAAAARAPALERRRDAESAGGAEFTLRRGAGSDDPATSPCATRAELLRTSRTQ